MLDNFADIVKDVRNQLKMSQEELARELWVSFATINRWENEKTTLQNWHVPNLSFSVKK